MGSCGMPIVDHVGGGKPLPTMTKKDLYARAKKAQIVGRSKMVKHELVTALRSHYKALGEKIRRRGGK